MAALPTSAPGGYAMNAMRSTVCLLACLAATTAVQAADTYLCVAEMTTGFNYDANKKAWRSADFRSDKKFAISRSKTKAYAWEAKEVGDARPAATCEKDFNEAGNLFCSGVFDLRFNRRQLRFLYAYPIGYWSDGTGAREGENTPAMAIGRCREL